MTVRLYCWLQYASIVLGSTAASRLQTTAAIYVVGTSLTPVIDMYTRLQSIAAALAPHTLYYVHEIQYQVA